MGNRAPIEYARPERSESRVPVWAWAVNGVAVGAAAWLCVLVIIHRESRTAAGAAGALAILLVAAHAMIVVPITMRFTRKLDSKGICVLAAAPTLTVVLTFVVLWLARLPFGGHAGGH